MTFCIIVKEKHDDKYSINDSVNERLFRTPEEAWNRLDQIQTLYVEKLIVVGN